MLLVKVEVCMYESFADEPKSEPILFLVLLTLWSPSANATPLSSADVLGW